MSDIKEDEEGVPRVEVVYKDEKPVTEPVTDLDKVKPPIVRTVKVGDLFYCADRGAEYSYVGKGQWQRTQTPTDAEQKKLDAVEAKRNKDAAEAKRQADAEQKRRVQDAEAARRDLDRMNALRAAVEDVISKKMTICDAAKAHGVPMTAIKKDERFIEAIRKTSAKKVVTPNATKGTYRYEVKKLTNGNNMYALMKFTVDFNKKEGKSELIGSESECIAKKEELEGKTAPVPKPAAGLVHIRKRCGGARDSWKAMCNCRALDGSEYPSHGLLRATNDKHDKPNCPACFAKREANKVRKTHAIDVKGTKTQWSDCSNKGRTFCSKETKGLLIAAKGEEPTCEAYQRYMPRPTMAESGYIQNPDNPFEWIPASDGAKAHRGYSSVDFTEEEKRAGLDDAEDL